MNEVEKANKVNIEDIVAMLDKADNRISRCLQLGIDWTVITDLNSVFSTIEDRLSSLWREETLEPVRSATELPTGVWRWPGRNCIDGIDTIFHRIELPYDPVVAYSYLRHIMEVRLLPPHITHYLNMNQLSGLDNLLQAIKRKGFNISDNVKIISGRFNFSPMYAEIVICWYSERFRR